MVMVEGQRSKYVEVNQKNSVEESVLSGAMMAICSFSGVRDCG